MMDAVKFSVVLKVRDLSCCRAFYQNVLELGNPVQNSSFWTEFALGGGRSLCLDASGPFENPSGGAPQPSESFAWLLDIPEPEEILAKLEASGNHGEPREVFGISCRRFRDPEGNPFYLVIPPDFGDTEPETR